MIRLIALPFIAAFLMGALPACDRETIDHYSALVTNHPDQFVALEHESKLAWEEEVVVEFVPEPEPPKCVDYLNRGVWYDCHGNWLRDL